MVINKTQAYLKVKYLKLIKFKTSHNNSFRMDYLILTKFQINKVFSNFNLNNLINKYFQIQIKQTKLFKIIKIKWNCKKMNNFYNKMLNSRF